MNKEAITEYLYRIADNQLIIGHRNSEWTGLGPILEEDIAFSSMAQDKIGHSLAFYELLHELGEEEPDRIAFLRNGDRFKNAQLCELPNGDYAFSLVRHFLYDVAEIERMKILSTIEIEEVALVASKIKGELLYHTMHANTWIKKLGNATEESKNRMQVALNECLPFARGLFEPSPFESDLKEMGLTPGEDAIERIWWEKVTDILKQTELEWKDLDQYDPVYGGRVGRHTEYLQPLLDEMAEVIKIDPDAEW